jgi:hypothetical protein
MLFTFRPSGEGLEASLDPGPILANAVCHPSFLQPPRIRTLTELDALIGEFVVGESPATHWEDSQGLFRFESEQEALDSLNDIYFQLFLPNLDWSQTVFVEVKSYRRYSSEFACTIEVIERLAAGGRQLSVTRKAGDGLLISVLRPGPPRGVCQRPFARPGLAPSGSMQKSIPTSRESRRHFDAITPSACRSRDRLA